MLATFPPPPPLPQFLARRLRALVMGAARESADAPSVVSLGATWGRAPREGNMWTFSVLETTISPFPTIAEGCVDAYLDFPEFLFDGAAIFSTLEYCGNSRFRP
jgi:hypothetical protein